MKNTDHFRQWLRHQMATRKWDATTLASRASLGPSVISRWFSGRTRDVEDKNMDRLCQCFSLTRQELFNIAEPGPPAIHETGPVWKLPSTADPRRRKLAEWIVREATAKYLDMIDCAMRCHTEEKGGSSAARGPAQAGQSS